MGIYTNYDFATANKGRYTWMPWMTEYLAKLKQRDLKSYKIWMLTKEGD